MRIRNPSPPSIVAVGVLLAISAVAGCPGLGPDPGFVGRRGFVPEPGPPPGCEESFDCAPDEWCNAGVCEFQSPCQENSECASNFCLDGFCFQCTDAFEVATCPGNSQCNAGVCIPFSPDFEVEIEPLLTTTACTACHQTDALPLPSTLGLDVGTDEIYRQLLEPDLGRVNYENPDASTLITKPVREDPPNHPVGVWDPAGEEVALILAWVRNGAPRFSPCRRVVVADAMVDCYEVEKPENVCGALVVDGIVQSVVIDACGTCRERFSDFESKALACLTVDDLDGGVAVDGGAPDGDAGTSDAGAPDAGVPDAGVPDAGVPEAGERFDSGVEDAG